MKPSLTVYKPGYVIWNSRRICPTSEPRTDFDENNRTVKLLKFETEAPRWMKEYPDRDGGKPYEMQNGCFLDWYDSGINRIYLHDEIKFQTTFYKYELPFLNKERRGQ